ncbi:precorrin-3B C(17)-methyltransferase [Clostridium pasteurianum]|uniref:precorrin-3B C(17)-methyltransferase n=1 Tax=Clostridium pasteurianum TaxID=1501 RepID=UPI002261007D|nr:precorrin-3B C(17)-methyltransferase [Clostridium pasteurianum]UZW15538.1 precorrin-3B C(17)-methyltransferase [Clostridium pasteurianum]
MGKLYVVGIGPGGLQHMTVRARQVIEESEVIVGYTKYIDFIAPLIENKEVFSTGMMKEEERCREALRLSKDKIVSIISTGDAGIYGMAGLVLELIENEQVEIVPGVTASSAAASILGAPIMHDSCNISLSDLMTPYELIKKRVGAAAQADFVITLYNPKSKGRPHYLKENIETIKKYRNGNTPVAVVKNALREGQEYEIFTLDSFDDSNVDMLSVVLIGNSQSFVKNGVFITPRGYKL